MNATKLASKRAGFFARFAAMAKVGLRMMFHDKLKMAGTLFGVVFAVVLSNQQLGTFLGLIYKNQMMLEITGMDLWIIPAGAETFAPGKVLPVTDAAVAETTPGVVWADAPRSIHGEIAEGGDGGGHCSRHEVPAPPRVRMAIDQRLARVTQSSRHDDL